MAQPKPRAATYADIVALPPGIVGEIVSGVLHTQPRPAPRHGVAASNLGALTNSLFGSAFGGGWIIIDEPELHLGPHVVVPDIAGWRQERLPTLPETAYFELSPDWVCEVMSPSTARFDRIEKLGVYAAFGVSHAWYVDPTLRTLEVFALVEGRWTIVATFKDADTVTAPPFETHAFSLGVLWPDDVTGPG
jgi:Uma2 family endonuclease